MEAGLIRSCNRLLLQLLQLWRVLNYHCIFPKWWIYTCNPIYIHSPFYLCCVMHEWHACIIYILVWLVNWFVLSPERYLGLDHTYIHTCTLPTMIYPANNFTRAIKYSHTIFINSSLSKRYDFSPDCTLHTVKSICALTCDYSIPMTHIYKYTLDIPPFQYILKSHECLHYMWNVQLN